MSAVKRNPALGEMGSRGDLDVTERLPRYSLQCRWKQVGSETTAN